MTVCKISCDANGIWTSPDFFPNSDCEIPEIGEAASISFTPVGTNGNWELVLLFENSSDIDTLIDAYDEFYTSIYRASLKIRSRAR